MEKILMETKRNLISKFRKKSPALCKLEKTKLLNMLVDPIELNRQHFIWVLNWRTEPDFCWRYDFDVAQFQSMRILHLHYAEKNIAFEIYVCNSEFSFFKTSRLSYLQAHPFGNVFMCRLRWSIVSSIELTIGHGIQFQKTVTISTQTLIASTQLKDFKLMFLKFSSPE